MPPQKTDDDSTHTMTVRLPGDVYEKLRRQAYDQRTSINALIVAALRARKT